MSRPSQHALTTFTLASFASYTSYTGTHSLFSFGLNRFSPFFSLSTTSITHQATVFFTSVIRYLQRAKCHFPKKKKKNRFWSVTRAHPSETRIQDASLAAVVWLETASRLKDLNVFSHGHSSWILNRCPEQPSGWETYEMYASANRKNSHEYTLTAQPQK